MDGCVMDWCSNQTHKSLFPELPFLSFCNIPIFFITVSENNNISHPVMWAFLGFCWLSQSFTNNNTNSTKNPFLPFSPFPFLLLLLHPLSLFHFLFSLLGFPFFFPSMKKIKGAGSHYPAFDDSMAGFKHRTLLQDYHDLDKETETAKRKLQMMKEKKMTLIAEVRFLRKRYEYLMKNHSSNYHRPNANPVQQKQFINQVANNNKKGKNVLRRRSALQPLPTISDIIQKERNDRGTGIPSQNATPIPVLDLNQKAKTSRKKANKQQNSTPVLDLIQKERMYSGRDASERTIAPFFDLNQISMEEEELQTHFEPVRAEELKKSFIRGGNDEQQNDMKISACRSVGDGPSRAGKRKISWQDQVALRV